MSAKEYELNYGIKFMKMWGQRFAINQPPNCQDIKCLKHCEDNN